MKKSKLLFLAIPILAISLGCSKPVDNTVALGAPSTEEREALKVMNGKDMVSRNQNQSKRVINGRILSEIQANEQNEKELTFNSKKFRLLNYVDSPNKSSYQFGNDALIPSNVYYEGTDAETGKAAKYIEASNDQSSVKEYRISHKVSEQAYSLEMDDETHMDLSYKSIFKSYSHQYSSVSLEKSYDANNKVSYKFSSMICKLKDIKVTWLDPSSSAVLIEWKGTAESEYKDTEGSSPFEVKVYHNNKTYTFYMNINLMRETSREADLKNSSGIIIGKLYIGENCKLTIKVYNADKQLVDL